MKADQFCPALGIRIVFIHWSRILYLPSNLSHFWPTSNKRFGNNQTLNFVLCLLLTRHKNNLNLRSKKWLAFCAQNTHWALGLVGEKSNMASKKFKKILVFFIKFWKRSILSLFLDGKSSIKLSGKLLIIILHSVLIR